MPRPSRTRRPMRAREVSVFATICAVSIDLLLTAFSIWASDASTRHQVDQLLSIWDLVQGVLVAIGMIVVVTWTRSAVFVVLSMVLGAIVVVEQTSGYAITSWILTQLGADTTSLAAGAPLYAYGPLMLLTALAILAVGAVNPGPRARANYVAVRKGLLILLGLLFAVSVLQGFLSGVTGSRTVEILDETGERLIMSGILGYIAGMLVSPFPPRA
jgi:hypothetical protein